MYIYQIYGTCCIIYIYNIYIQQHEDTYIEYSGMRVPALRSSPNAEILSEVGVAYFSARKSPSSAGGGSNSASY